MIVSDTCTICIKALARAINYAPRLVNYYPRVMLQIVLSLIDASRGVIYNRNMFIVVGHMKREVCFNSVVSNCKNE